MKRYIFCTEIRKKERVYKDKTTYIAQTPIKNTKQKTSIQDSQKTELARSRAKE